MSKKKINPFASIDEIVKQVEVSNAQRKKTMSAFNIEEPLMSNVSEPKIDADVEIKFEKKIEQKIEIPIKVEAELINNVPIKTALNSEMGTLNSNINGNIKLDLEENNTHIKSDLMYPFKTNNGIPKLDLKSGILNGNIKSVHQDNKNKLIELGIIDKEQLKKDYQNTNTKYMALLRILINSALDADKIVVDEGERFKVTGMTLVAQLSDEINSSQQVTKNIIRSLIEKHEIKRLHSELGRNGFVIYGFKEDTFPHLVKLANGSNLNGNEKSVLKEVNKSVHQPSSKLVSNNNTKLTNTSELTPDEIDLTGLAKLGITKKHLNDLKNQQLPLTNMKLQDFANKFAIYASNPGNVRNVGSLPGLFCKMAQLVAKGEDPLSDIETDEDRAINERIVALKRKKEEKDRRLTELMDLEFEDWYGSLNSEAILDLVPEVKMVSNTDVRMNLVKQHFINNVWKGY